MVEAARVAQNIRHSKLAAVLDFIVTEQEIVVVGEYVEGPTLSLLQRLMYTKRAPLPPAVALRIGVDLLRGLCAARDGWRKHAPPELHAASHAGLLPENVFIATFGEVLLGEVGVSTVASALEPFRSLPRIAAYRHRSSLVPARALRSAKARTYSASESCSGNCWRTARVRRSRTLGSRKSDQQRGCRNANAGGRAVEVDPDPWYDRPHWSAGLAGGRRGGRARAAPRSRDALRHDGADAGRAAGSGWRGRGQLRSGGGRARTARAPRSRGPAHEPATDVREFPGVTPGHPAGFRPAYASTPAARRENEPAARRRFRRAMA